MKMNSLFFALLAVAGLSSCSKDMVVEQEPEPEQEKDGAESAADYLQLKAGNMWVYESYSVDLVSGETRPLKKRDSLFVRQDTTIDRAKYHILEGTRLGEPFFAILRTSGPNLIDAEGHVLFSADVLEDTLSVPADLLPAGVHSAFTVVNEVKGMEVPYGFYDALAQHVLWYFPAGSSGLPEESCRHDTAYYVKGVGLAKYASQMEGSPIRIEMRLVSR
ncbi:MAG: hypothetical protein KDC66_08825 [Phaeodactylibacter sp.]|nr:hypothetical protein [Phaeodactylibacter sp.]MCB9272710.1 hypothetical protein [Lewinellaceae bacterium]